MSNKIRGLAKKYILWPEIENEYQKNIDFSNTGMKEYRKSIHSFIEKRESIESRIALFYLINEELSTIRNTTNGVLSQNDIDLYKVYTKSLDKISKEVFAYLLVSCVVESRHTHAVSDLSGLWERMPNKTIKWNNYLDDPQNYKKIKKDPVFNKFKNLHFKHFRKHFSEEEQFHKFVDFMILCEFSLYPYFQNRYNRNQGYKDIADVFLAKEIGNFNVGESLEFLEIIFSMDYFSGGYGGPAWAKIAQHAKNFAFGKINAEMFIDQAFSLEHNNGNVFNKDFLFDQNECYSFPYLDNDFDSTDSTIKPISLLLTAQHLGCLKGLLTLTNNWDDIDSLVSNIEHNDSYEHFSESIQDSDGNFFIKNTQKLKEKNNLISYLKSRKEFSNAQYNDLQNIVELLPDFINNFEETIIPIKKQLMTLLEEVDPNQIFKLNKSPINLKKLFYQVVTTIGEDDERDDNFYSLELATNNYNNNIVSFFDIVNYFNNEKFHNSNIFSIEDNLNFSLHDIENISSDYKNKNIIGGKAWSLVNMFDLHLPVPKAKVFTTDCCKLFYNNHQQYQKEITHILPTFNDYLKNENNDPILCSVRSGSPVSMPGMMDTILNVGIDDSNYDYFCKKLGKKVTNECITKFMELFCSSRFNIKLHLKGSIDKKIDKFKNILENNNIDYNKEEKFPLTKERQIEESLYAVFNSWHSERAKAYRIEKSISDFLGTAAIVQQMVFGNLNDNSCTGVVFSRNCVTGENQLVGEFLPKAQGEDVVSGAVTPFPIEQFKAFNPQAYEQLSNIAKKLEQQTGQIQDIEFTVEDGKLYILQHRQAVCSPIAALKLLKENNISTDSLLEQINTDLIQPSYKVSSTENHNFQGLPANPGVLNGIIIKKESDIKKYAHIFNENKIKDDHFGWIFYAQLTSPEHMPIMNKTDAFITEQGGFTSHAAIISRSLNKPCVVGIGESNIKAGQIITLDAKDGKIWNKKQEIIYDDSLVETAVNAVLDSQNITLDSVKNLKFNSVDKINKMSSWMTKFPESKIIKESHIKLDKFFNIGQKVAMFLIAEQKNNKKIKP